MPVPRMRFRVRTAMVAVAIVALAIGGEMLRRRSADFREEAKRFANLELLASEVAESHEAKAARSQGQADQPDDEALRESREAEDWRRTAARVRRLRDIYRRATSRPWEAVVEPGPHE